MPLDFIDRLGMIVLSRALTVARHPLTTSRLRSLTRRLLADSEFEPRADRALDLALEELCVEQRLRRLARRSYQLTDAGRERALEFHRRSDTPPARKWETLLHDLCAALLRLPPLDDPLDRQRFGLTRGIHAALACLHYGLEISPYEREAMICQCLAHAKIAEHFGVRAEISPPPRISRPHVGLVLTALAGGDELQAPEKALGKLGARIAGCSDSGAHGIRLCLLSRWLKAGSPLPVPTPEPLASRSVARRPPARRPPASLQQGRLRDFVGQLKRAAAFTVSGRVGDALSISHLYDGYRLLAGKQAVTREDFDQELVAAHRRGALVLLSLPPGAPLTDEETARSRVEDGRQVWHLLRTGDRRRRQSGFMP